MIGGTRTAVTTRTPRRTEAWTAFAFAASGVTFLLFPVLRPWPDETVASAALVDAFASTRWIVAHLCGIVGLTLLALAFLGLRALLAAHATDDGARSATAPPGVRAATAAAATAWAGAAASGLYFGAEMFGLHTLAVEGAASTIVDAADTLRFQPIAMALFGAGLLLLAAAGVLAAIATTRSTAYASLSAILLAAALVLVLPQFFGGPELRIAHGIVYAVACAAMAYTVLRPRPQR